MLKHLLPVSGKMFLIEDRQINVVLAEQIEQCSLALNLRNAAKVPVTPQKVEGIIDEPVLPARRQLCLQF